MIKAKLSGKAYDAIKFVADLDSWEKVKQALTNNIAPPMNAATAQNKLIRAQQKGDESVRDFSARVKSYLSDLNKIQCKGATVDVATYIEANNGATAKRAFEDGINNPHLKTILLSSNKERLEDIIALALEQEVRVRTVTRGNQNPVQSQMKCRYCKETGHLIADCTSRPPQKSREPDIVVQKPKCTHCGRNNHESDKCFKYLNELKKKQAEGSNPSKNSVQTGAVKKTQPMRCHYCGETDHWITACPSRPPASSSNVTIVRTQHQGETLGQEEN